MTIRLEMFFLSDEFYNEQVKLKVAADMSSVCVWGGGLDIKLQLKLCLCKCTYHISDASSFTHFF